MDWETRVNRAEQTVDVFAAAIFAGAVGFALRTVAPGVAVANASVAVFLLARFALGRIVPETSAYPVPAFPLAAIEPVLNEQGEAENELILEDKLAEVSPDARVVRLFGHSQSHLRSSNSEPASPDASQALSNALAELRRALR